jgi:hypothetical protein
VPNTQAVRARCCFAMRHLSRPSTCENSASSWLLKLKSFLNGANAKTNSGKPSRPQAQKANGAAFAQLLDVGVTNGQCGERFYLNVEVNGRRARMFGTAAQIARAISTVGEKLFAQDIEPGLQVDLPCRVLTQESRDGRYLNVTRVLPLPRQGNAGAHQ